MRATGRRLEVIIAEAGVVKSKTESEEKSLAMIQQAAMELRRRGDTLVGRDDLRTVLRHVALGGA